LNGNYQDTRNWLVTIPLDFHGASEKSFTQNVQISLPGECANVCQGGPSAIASELELVRMLDAACKTLPKVLTGRIVPSSG
jgi:hypothetical protein